MPILSHVLRGPPRGKPIAAVAGAGIAGLAAAKALADLGYEVRVLERERELRTEGAGLTLWPNAVRALLRANGELPIDPIPGLDS